MWQARTRDELIIEVWEKLDCGNVGAAEIVAIETAVSDRFGADALMSPMSIARLLADEGAHLRHAEIMKLYVDRAEHDRYEAAFQNLNFADIENTLRSIRQLESLRRFLAVQNDRAGLERIRQTAAAARQSIIGSPAQTAKKSEIGEWLRIWLQTPELFENWIVLRQAAPEFIAEFGELKTNLSEQ